MKYRIIDGVKYYEIPKSMVTKKHNCGSSRGCRFCIFTIPFEGLKNRNCNSSVCCPDGTDSTQVFFNTKRSFFKIMSGKNPYGK